jgi:hypothetical protein
MSQTVIVFTFLFIFITKLITTLESITERKKENEEELYGILPGARYHV